ncbi:MAG: electron transfer flavoprotein subunit beta [Chloroflexota bacterium]|nr:MAG: electron transfer flavoprotein subunit beta [Chloroflexota bacterium]
MKVAVLVKQTPDTAELPKVSAEDVRSGKVKATMVINPWDEFAAEEAILLGDRYDVDSVAISMGSPDAVDALKHALAMGVGAAALVDSSDISGGDMWTTSSALAAAVKAEGAELVITGKQSVDDNSGAVYAGVAAKLGWPLVSAVTKVVDISNGQITVERMVEGAQETISVSLPAVISVVKEINEPRYPSFMGIRKAAKANIPVTPAANLGVASGSGKTQWTNIRKPEERKTKCVIIDGATVEEKAAKLVDALMAEKVI